MVKRRIEAVSRGHQSFEDRFPGKRRRLDEGLPPIAPWRSNLTALSQEHNLYFVGYGSDIYVYEPEFSDQAIREPAIIVSSDPSSSDLRGFMDADEPHAINHLIVKKLGKDEVIATVRDDGDVEVFLVRHIEHAIRSPLSLRQETVEVVNNVRPIFQANVGSSAWGLAIHSHARILAVSSNRHEVTVFRFALVDEGVETKPSRRKAWLKQHRGLYDTQSTSKETASTERKTDVTHQVINGESNIPHIAFCNTGDDPEARWLITTDISGVCRIMDLHKVSPVQAFRFGPSFAYAPHGGYDRMNAGWCVQFLDTRSFALETSVSTALGLESKETLPDARINPDIWDLTKTLRHLSDVSDTFAAPKPKSRPRSSNAISPASSSISGATSPTSQDTPALTSTSTISLADVIQQMVHIDQTATQEDLDQDEVTANGTQPTSSHDDDDDLHDFLPTYDSDSDSEPTEDSISHNAIYNGERICGNLPQFVRHTDLCEDLPCPIFHASIRNIYLLQPSNQRLGISGPFNSPVVGFASPLKQSIQAEYRGLNMFDRLNMHAIIPSLGVVIVASQKGRAIVLALTKLKLGGKTDYAMRAEAILPFASQERAGERRFSPLHGIAVGPVQGTECKRDEQKRWRLMMMYQDHSILSYEIRRVKGGEDSVGDVIV